VVIPCSVLIGSPLNSGGSFEVCGVDARPFPSEVMYSQTSISMMRGISNDGDVVYMA